MGRRVLLLCVTVAGVMACCECALLSHEARPLVETDLHLTAADTDSGNWTANLGDIEVKIEHTHGDTSANEGGAWTMDVARMVYEKQNGIEESDNKALPKEDTDKVTATAEIPQENTAEGTDKPTVVSKAADESDDMNNEITNYDSYSRKSTESDMATVTSNPICQYLRVKRSADCYEEDNAVEVDCKPNNFKNVEGVGSFKLDERHLTWAAARDACAKVGSHLAVPDTKKRVEVFVDLMHRHCHIPACAILRHQVYVGVSDHYRNRTYTTVQGMRFAPNFRIWFCTEPDKAPPGKCVTVHIDGTLRRVPCFLPLPFFCEKDIPTKIHSSQKKKSHVKNLGYRNWNG